MIDRDQGFADTCNLRALSRRGRRAARAIRLSGSIRPHRSGNRFGCWIGLYKPWPDQPAAAKQRTRSRWPPVRFWSLERQHDVPAEGEAVGAALVTRSGHVVLVERIVRRQGVIPPHFRPDQQTGNDRQRRLVGHADGQGAIRRVAARCGIHIGDRRQTLLDPDRIVIARVCGDKEVVVITPELDAAVQGQRVGQRVGCVLRRAERVHGLVVEAVGIARPVELGGQGQGVAGTCR